MTQNVYDFPELVDLAQTTATDLMTQTLGNEEYTPNKCPDWIHNICESVIEKMRIASPNFKYLVSCIIVQKVGAGLHYESVAHWDAKSDAAVVARFDSPSM
eukprot:gene9762-13170_t